MMPVIRIGEDTWERMKAHARPLEDTPDDIVRRALDALEGKKAVQDARRRAVGRPRSNASGQKLPQKELGDPLLLTLDALGGSASLHDVKTGILPRIKSRLSDGDYGRVSNGDERWWNAVCWERSDLVKSGLLRSTSPRGVWELSDAGRERVRKLKEA